MQNKISRITLLSATAALGVTAFAAAPAASAASAPVAVVSQPAAGADLHAGSRGAAVSAWQRDIDTVSGKVPGLAKVAVDGVYGPRTVEATKQFQRFAKIAADGVVGPRTRAAMNTALHGAPSAPVASAPELRLGSRGAAVSTWQQDINIVSGKVPGLPKVTRDGVYGPRTAAATQVFQRFAKVPADGVVGPRTRTAMDTALHGAPAGR